MTVEEFVWNLYENAYEHSKMTIKEAETDIENFKLNAKMDADPDEDYSYLDELTPEIYMEIWNGFYEEERKSAEKYSNWEEQIIWNGDVAVK